MMRIRSTLALSIALLVAACATQVDEFSDYLTRSARHAAMDAAVAAIADPRTRNAKEIWDAARHAVYEDVIGDNWATAVYYGAQGPESYGWQWASSEGEATESDLRLGQTMRSTAMAMGREWISSSDNLQDFYGGNADVFRAKLAKAGLTDEMHTYLGEVLEGKDGYANRFLERREDERVGATEEWRTMITDFRAQLIP